MLSWPPAQFATEPVPCQGQDQGQVHGQHQRRGLCNVISERPKQQECSLLCAPVKQDASNSLMDGFRSRPTANRSSMLWYSRPSAPSTCKQRHVWSAKHSRLLTRVLGGFEVFKTRVHNKPDSVEAHCTNSRPYNF